MRYLFALAVALPLLATNAVAQVPQILHHQGRITSGGVNFDGAGKFKFLLYATKTSGSVLGPIWKNDDSNPTTMAEPATVVSTTVTKGLYSVALGESPQAPLTGDLLQPVVLLRIWFDDGVNGLQQLAPDRKIASVPFALQSDRASTVVDASITSASLSPSLKIPNVQSGIHQTQISPPWISSPLPYAVSFPTAFTTPPVVTVSPGVDSRSPVYGVSGTGFSGTVEVPPDTWSSTVENVFSSTRPSVFEVDGRPALVYGDGAAQAVRFAINSMADGSGIWTLTTVDSVDSTGKEPSLALADGRPSIAYVDTTDSQLRFAINSTSDGSGSWVISAVHPGSTFHSPSMASLNGKPAIAYLLRTGSPVNLTRQWFAVNSAADGTGTWARDLIGEVDGPLPTSMAVVGGLPTVAFRQAGQLKLAVDPSGTGAGPWSVSTIVESGSNPSIAAIDDRPMIAFHTGSRADFWRPQQVDIQRIAVGQ